ncbi:MAG TPA: prolyl oligopeptidase family serine peptidase, partial [Acidimicrobiia bacterium]|nr:prolyl oligopeptidase family serine peptidase [Acidimicrobiia bacterium]
RYDAGEWIYTDFVYDDYGADTTPGGQPNVVSLAPTSGDFRYPDGAEYADNAADIVEVRVRADGDDLVVRVLLQTITDPSVVALWVEVDGVESVVTADTADTAAVDADANTVEFSLPGAASSGSVALNLGAGLHDGQGGLRAGVPGTAQPSPGEFTTGGPTDARLFDLAFNTRDIEGRGGAWNEDVQSDALAAGDLAPFVQTVDVDALDSGTTTEPEIEPGYSVLLFESRQSLGEGVAGSFPQYRGRWQPYAVWVPQAYTPGTAAPLFLSLHSLSVHHNQYRGGASPSASYATYYEQFEAGTGAIVVTPLGRGPDGWYHDEALVDTLEVWADALARFTIDPERILVGGYSMGGYGTYRLATLMPDAFASAVSIVGPPTEGIWAYPLPPTGGEDSPGNTRPQLENTRHVPFWITQGVADELVPVAGVVHQAERFRELGHEYRLAVHPAADHLSFVFQDEWSREVAWFAGHPERTTDPHRVTFKVRPASWADNGDPDILGHVAALTAEVGARLDGAYWVDDVEVVAGGDVTGFVDLSSGGVATRQTGVTGVTTVGTDGPSPHLLTGQDQVFAPAATDDTLSGSLSGVTAVTVDVGRAGLSDAPDVSVTSDTPAVITLVRDGAVVGEVHVG